VRDLEIDVITRRLRLASITLLAATSTLGCAGPSDESRTTDSAVRSGAIELSVDLQAGGTWEMAGPLVDASAVCSHGFGRNVAILDATTRTPLDAAEFQQRLQAISSPTELLDVIFVVERRCSDGSGSLLIEDDMAARELRVVAGTGAYSAARGAGSFTWGTDLTGTPEYVLSTLDLDLDAATGP
jgi:hypothetical protein